MKNNIVIILILLVLFWFMMFYKSLIKIDKRLTEISKQLQIDKIEIQKY